MQLCDVIRRCLPSERYYTAGLVYIRETRSSIDFHRCRHAFNYVFSASLSLSHLSLCRHVFDRKFCFAFFLQLLLLFLCRHVVSPFRRRIQMIHARILYLLWAQHDDTSLLDAVHVVSNLAGGDKEHSGSVCFVFDVGLSFLSNDTFMC